MHALLAVVHMGDEVADAALELEHHALAAGALVGQRDPQPLGQEGHLPHPLGQRLEREVGLLEDLAVRQERDRGAGLGGLLALHELRLRLAALVLLAPDMAVAPDLQQQLLRQRVDDRDADAVQPS